MRIPAKLEAHLNELRGRVAEVSDRLQRRIRERVAPRRDEGDPMHVCHLVPRLQLSGAEAQVVALCNALEPSATMASCMAVGERGHLAQRVEPRVQVWSLHEPALAPALVPRLARELRRYGVDVLQTHGLEVFALGVLAGRLAGVRRVVNAQHEPPSRVQGPAEATRLAVGLTDAFVAASRPAALGLADALGLSADAVRVIPPGVDTERLRPAVEREALRESLGLEPGELVVGTLGRLLPGRGHETVLQTLSILAGEGLPVRGVVAGDGPERPALEARVRELGLVGRVRLPGFVPDVGATLALMDVFVLPYGARGPSVSLLEAMSCGLPVVAVHEGGNVDLVRDNQSGVLVPSGDPQALAHTLRQLHADPERRAILGRRAREHVLDEHPVALMAKRYQDLYDEILGPDWMLEGPKTRVRRLLRGLRGR